MQPQPPQGAQPPYPPDYGYSRAADWPKMQMTQFIDMVVARDPVRGAELSLLYGIRDRIEQVTIAMVITDILLFIAVIVLFARP